MKNTRDLLHEITDEIIACETENPRNSRMIFDILYKHIVPIIREKNSLISYIKGTIINNSANFIKGYEETED